MSETRDTRTNTPTHTTLRAGSEAQRGCDRRGTVAVDSHTSQRPTRPHSQPAVGNRDQDATCAVESGAGQPDEDQSQAKDFSGPSGGGGQAGCPAALRARHLALLSAFGAENRRHLLFRPRGGPRGIRLARAQRAGRSCGGKLLPLDPEPASHAVRDPENPRQRATAAFHGEAAVTGDVATG